MTEQEVVQQFEAGHQERPVIERDHDEDVPTMRKDQHPERISRLIPAVMYPHRSSHSIQVSSCFMDSVLERISLPQAALARSYCSVSTVLR